MTPEQLTAYMVDHGIRSSIALKKRRTVDNDCPYLHDYIAAFGSFSAALGKAFPKMPVLFPTPVDPAYMLDCCERFHISTQKNWLTCRRLPDTVVPSSRQVRRVWGNFSNMLYAARQVSAQKTLDSYLTLERRLGHRPSAIECREVSLDLSPVRKYLGNKRSIDKLLA